MNEYIIVVLLVAGALLYVIRFVIRVARGKDSGCSCCSGSCGTEQSTKCETAKIDQSSQTK